MNVLAVFVKNTLLIYASFDLHHLSAIYLKKNKLYIYFGFLEVFYIHFVLQILCATRPSVCGGSAFPGDFLARELGKIFVF